MNVLITGGKGFIGHNLVNFLIKKNIGVVVIDNETRISPGFKAHKNVQYIHVDACNTHLPSFLEGFKIDAVIHLAATVSVDECDKSPIQSFQNNVTSTVAMAEFCKKNKIENFIFASTAAVYLKEKSQYGFSKYISEEYIKHCFKKSNTAATILRFFNVYGPGAHSNGAYAPVIEKFLLKKEKGEPLTLYKPGYQTRDFIHVEDICNLIYKILFYQKRPGSKIFDVCTGKSISIKDIAKLISKNIITEERQVNEVITSESKDPEKVVRAFNWRPKYNLKKYIKTRL
jgi:UDP-glucose 4-epimerase